MLRILNRLNEDTTDSRERLTSSTHAAVPQDPRLAGLELRVSHIPWSSPQQERHHVSLIMDV